MKKFNTPTAIILWPKSSPTTQSVNTIIGEHFPFKPDPNGVPDELKGSTGVVIENGVVKSYSGASIRRAIWVDPLEEKDLVLVLSDSLTTTYQECRDVLNLVSPVKTQTVVTFASLPNAALEAGFRVSVAVSLARDADALVGRAELYRGRRIVGPAGILLGVSAELDQSAFCILIEHPPDSEFVSSAAVEAALLTFSHITGIETFRGHMSEQAIRARKHLKEMAEKRRQDCME